MALRESCKVNVKPKSIVYFSHVYDYKQRTNRSHAVVCKHLLFLIGTLYDRHDG